MTQPTTPNTDSDWLEMLRYILQRYYGDVSVDAVNAIEQWSKESNLALLERIKSGLEDYIDEVRVGNDMAWRQVVHFDDVDTVFEAIRKEYE